jgi:hypothetical protein
MQVESFLNKQKHNVFAFLKYGKHDFIWTIYISIFYFSFYK